MTDQQQRMHSRKNVTLAHGAKCGPAEVSYAPVACPFRLDQLHTASVSPPLSAVAAVSSDSGGRQNSVKEADKVWSADKLWSERALQCRRTGRPTSSGRTLDAPAILPHLPMSQQECSVETLRKMMLAQKWRRPDRIGPTPFPPGHLSDLCKDTCKFAQVPPTRIFQSSWQTCLGQAAQA